MLVVSSAADDNSCETYCHRSEVVYARFKRYTILQTNVNNRTQTSKPDGEGCLRYSDCRRHRIKIRRALRDAHSHTESVGNLCECPNLACLSVSSRLFSCSQLLSSCRLQMKQSLNRKIT